MTEEGDELRWNKTHVHASILQTFAKHIFNAKIEKWSGHQDVLKLSRALVLRFIQLCKPPAACFGNNYEDYEEEAHSPDGCYRQHHRCQNAWNRKKKGAGTCLNIDCSSNLAFLIKRFRFIVKSEESDPGTYWNETSGVLWSWWGRTRAGLERGLLSPPLF